LPGDPGPDPRNDLVRLILGNLNEVVLQIATFGGNEQWTEFPNKDETDTPTPMETS